MTTTLNDFRQGIPKTGGIASCIAANSGVALWNLSTGRTAKVRKLHIFNNNGAPTIVSIGTGLLGAFVAAMPGWYCVNGQELTITEEMLGDLEFTANITVAASVAAAAPADVQVQATVTEYMGPNG